MVQATRSVWQNLQRTSTPAPELERAGTALSALVTQLVHNRGITAPTLDEFLTPNRGPTYDPFLLTGMDAAVTRILQARAVGELVAVYGDSDVDGIAAAALLVEALTAAGIRAIPYIPNRQVEAAGTQRDVLNYLQARGASLIITVDCGISSAEEIEAAKLAGLDVIVTDHHAPPANLPSAVSIIDPLQSNCSYPCKHLAGVGVAYKLAQALYRRAGLRDELARLLLDLVAIGTIADMVPLVDENRSLVWHGLRVLNRAARPGIQSLISLAGLRCGTLSASDVCYSLCPRINAAGRIGDGSLGYALLTAQTIDDAEAHAALIEERKSERQVLIQQAYAACQQELCRQDARLYDRIIVVHVDPKASSAIGILAGKLAEEYGRPVIVLQPSGDEVRGCVRGTPSFAMLDALRANSDLLMNFGGHQQAAGFVMRPENVATLVDHLRCQAANALTDDEAVPRLMIDAEISPHEVGWHLYDQLQALEPCGVGNPSPVFLCRRLRLVEFKCVGNNHLRLTLRRGDRQLSAIMFRRGDLAQYLRRNSEVDLVFGLEVNDWNGDRTLQLRVRDLCFDAIGCLDLPDSRAIPSPY